MAEERPPVGFAPVGDGVGESVGEGDRDGVGLPSVGVGVAEAVVGALSGTDCSTVGSAVPDGAVSVQPTRAAVSTVATIHRPTIIGP
ncbi:hypothetical protein [Kribbella sp. CA-294648]|uniref:hypothetical protein n=1 Tax=Kribbella sp. CA-294648 TaxID=3239948 RepID=UPI003D924550